MNIREELALVAENDYAGIKPGWWDAALKRRIATIVARAKLATEPPKSWYPEIPSKDFFRIS